MMPELTNLELWERLESVNLSNEAFKHREHVRAAFVALSTSADLAEGALRFRRALKQFAHAHGAEFLAAYPELLNHRGILGRYYDVETLTQSPLARRLFLLPGSEQLASAAPGSR